ncbi:replication protein A 70 kDa DNA-binding subunit C-like [Phragmites australis]|uniref:replication protein A 70 kDa DNA-binding subunit C-like n=1 Tax=Phragmites australis TaxID=29695 RepID=UPI002D778242|nr:replication protein A 70 kDa DNA-binding subunit C-like [Phragmites australis]
MEYSLLSQINPTRHNWCIKVRVARMWQLSGTSKGKDFTAMKLALVDEEGVGITACIGQKDLNKFAKTLVEGRSYMIKKFQVSRQAKKFNAVPNTHTIFFTLWTVVEEVPTELSNNLPLYIFNFVDFEGLDRRARNDHGLVDVIGQLTVIHPVVQFSGLNGPSIRQSVELRDLSDQLLSITLWGEHATSFEDEFLIETIGKDEPVVIIFAGMKVRQYLGATTCGSGAATKWYMNIDIPEVNAFRASLQGRGSEVLFLPGDSDAAAGDIDKAISNRKTVSELLSLDPHDTDDVCFTCDAKIKEIDVSNGWWYKGCSTCKRGLKATFEGFECTNCDETKPMMIPSYKLNVVIKDSTGRAKIFLFGGVVEQVVRRTADELVEESSSNQILLPTPLRSLVGRRYVFQVVISEQTFRTGQLCFHARKVFAGDQHSGADATGREPPKDPSVKSAIGTASTTYGKETKNSAFSLTEAPIDPEGGSTPPHETHTVTTGKNSSTKGKEVLSSAHDKPGSLLGKRSRAARKELFSAKKEKASDE